MFYSKKTARMIICASVFFGVLSGCYKEGFIRGSNELILNGSLLKGPVSGATITITNYENKAIWQGVSDRHGNFSSRFSLVEDSLFNVTMGVEKSTEMICDALECFDDSGNLIASYAEEVLLSELGDIQLKSLGSSNTTNTSFQINALTTLVYDQIEGRLEDGISNSGLQRVARDASKVILTALNLDIEETNLLDIHVLYLDQASEQQKQNNQATTLAIINAAMAADLSKLSNISQAISDFNNNPNSDVARVNLSNLKTDLMGSAKRLIDSGEVSNLPLSVATNVELAKNSEIKFEILSAAIEALSAQIEVVNAQSRISGASGGSN
ncbi:hypothetical protein N480_17665 [Pseudoalteromonas luteoviolacea S2607]|uniref:hypothetical protein n=1 Tax=Pseudoalteromonas luteoviolacea TaxID=43657 RepID=UPI0007B0A777|nr:hypothetical protein [Pseudoalteromonas luteoviolacea]KZN36528.1 hypothetical protein N480_17665 [Pseudoalteromonas luteoviolacea S2607]